MALNCEGRPPDPNIQESGYWLTLKNSSDMNMSMAAAEEVVTTSTGRSYMALNSYMLTGSVPACNYLGPSSNDDYRAMMGPDYHHDCQGVKRLQVQQQGYGQAGCGAHNGGQGAIALRLHKGAPQHHHTPDDRDLGSGLQLQASTNHHRAYFNEMSAAAMSQLGGQDPQQDTGRHQGYHENSGAVVAVQVQGEADHHRGQDRIERVEKSVQQNMRMSPGLIMMQGGEEKGSMSMEDEGVGISYGSSIEAGAGGIRPQEAEQMRVYMAGDHDDMNGQGGQLQLGSTSSMMMMMKKKRLTKQQVKSLEVSFERESKLEPERKKKLAEQLGLQPRQVAVWFQNRRARFKTRQLQRDFDLLKHQYDAVRSHKDKLLAEVAKLKSLLGAASNGANENVQEQGIKTVCMDHKGQTTSPPASSSEMQIKDLKVAPIAGLRKQHTTSEVAAHAGNQNTKSNDKALSNTRDDGYVLGAAPKSSSKGSFTLEVKPSLQVPHIEHHQSLQRHMPSTLGPPTKLSLSSPQLLFLHHMLAMKVDTDFFHLHAQPEPQCKLLNDHYTIHSHDHNQDKEDGSDSMLCFNSTLHHDP